MLQEDILSYPSLKHVYQVVRYTTTMKPAGVYLPTILDPHAQTSMPTLHF
jgi:hypothetical protein